MGVETVCLMYAVHCTVVARNDVVMKLGTPLSGVATAMNGGSVDIERLYGYRRYETKDGRR